MILAEIFWFLSNLGIRVKVSVIIFTPSTLKTNRQNIKKMLNGVCLTFNALHAALLLR